MLDSCEIALNWQLNVDAERFAYRIPKQLVVAVEHGAPHLVDGALRHLLSTAGAAQTCSSICRTNWLGQLYRSPLSSTRDNNGQGKQ